MPGAIMMDTCAQDYHHKQTRDNLGSMPIRTTLYDLIGAIRAEAGSQASDVITAAVIHALQAYHISCLGDFAGYRMILGEKETSCSAVA